MISVRSFQMVIYKRCSFFPIREDVKGLVLICRFIYEIDLGGEKLIETEKGGQFYVLHLLGAPFNFPREALYASPAALPAGAVLSQPG